MRTLDLDLPLEVSPISRFMLWTTGGLVFLAVLAFALASLAQGRLIDYLRQPRIVTVALPPAAPDEAPGLVREVVALLERERGAAYAALVSQAEMDELVEPILGDAPAGAVPLPRLIDVAFNPGVEPDLAKVEDRVHGLVPGATLGDAGTLERSNERLARLLRNVGVSAGGVLVLLTLGAVVMITRMGLHQHDDTVDLLRLMGARDAYVARQFEHHALISAFRGGLTGYVLAMLLVIGTVYGPGWLGYEPLVPVRLEALDWVLLSMVPAAAALLVTLTARLTAYVVLRRRKAA